MSVFGDELIESAREARDIARGERPAGLVHVPDAVDVAAIRRRKGLSQRAFANGFGLALGTVRDWEQGRRLPDRTARILLMVIDREPEAVARTLRQA